MSHKRSEKKHSQMELALPVRLRTEDSKWIDPLPEDYATEEMAASREFACADEADRVKYSNSMTFWDAVPKHVSNKDMARLRDGNRRLPVLVRRFVHKGVAWQLSIQPASVIHRDGRTIDYYPSAREALVEDALRKIATEAQQGYCGKRNNGGGRSGVRFSMKQIRELLEGQKRYLSHQDIMEAIAVMQSVLLTIVAEDGREGLGTHILGDIYMGPRNGRQAQFQRRWIAEFNNIVTQELMAGCYRQYHFDTMITLQTQLARWLYLFCVRTWLNASPRDRMRIGLLDIQRDSGLLECARLSRANAKLHAALKELEEAGIVVIEGIEEKRGTRNALRDMRYSLAATQQFTGETVRANRRARQVKRRLANKG